MQKLTELQNELKAPKTQFNKFGKYNYRNCEDILEAVKPLLKKYKLILTVSDKVHEVGGLIYVEATANIIDEKGNEATATASAGVDPNKKGMDLAQCFGSSSSYARKFALSGLLLLDDSKEIDSEKVEPKKQKLTAERFNKALEAIGAGNYTKEQLLNEYELTKEQKAKL